MKTIETALQPTDGYINSFTRNTVEGWWELEVGLPKTWVYDENDKIGCEIIFENEMGKLLKVFPKESGVAIDDLISFVRIIIKTNERIAEKEKEFTDKIQKMKDMLEDEAIHFYEELDELKENSFKNLNATFAKNLEKEKATEKPKAPRKPRTPRTPIATIGEGTVTTKKAVSTTTQKKPTKTVTEETENLE